MNKVYLGFAKRNGFNLVSSLIRLFERTPFSHVYVRIESGWLERDVIYEASGSQVHFKAKPIWLAVEEVVAEFEVPMSDAGYKKMMQFCMDNAGKPYGLKSLLGFIVVYAGRAIGRTWKNPFRDGGATYVCSELGGVILRDDAGDTTLGNTDDMTPKTLYEQVVGRYKKVA